jgi:hypothetical protein
MSIWKSLSAFFKDPVGWLMTPTNPSASTCSSQGSRDIAPYDDFAGTEGAAKPDPWGHGIQIIAGVVNTDFSTMTDVARAAVAVENKQLRFLLSQAPMIDAPQELSRAAHSVTKFAYVHPKTLAAFTRGAYSPQGSEPFIRIRPSPTKWVMTSLMPENVVIYSQNPMPMLEKILAD